VDLFFFIFIALAIGWVTRVRQQQRQRIALLARLLSPLNIEKHVETVFEGYTRALGESDPHRREQVLGVLHPSEEALSGQMERLAQAVGEVDGVSARVSKLPVSTPWPPGQGSSFDLRELMRIHARGIGRAVGASPDTPARDRAYTIMAEVMLMQHSCHWFCRSRQVASARLLARHRTPYEQVLASVLPQTRAAYLELVSSRAPTPAG
jgi:hypothetical protein